MREKTLEEKQKEEKQAQGNKILGMIKAQIKSGVGDPSSSFQLAVMVVQESGLGKEALDEVLAIYLEEIAKAIMAYSNSSQGEFFKKDAEKFISNLTELVKGLDDHEEKYKLMYRASKLIDQIAQNPNSEQARKAARELIEGYNDKEAFKKRFLEAHTDLQQLKNKKEEIVTQYDKLKNTKHNAFPHKETLLTKIGNAVKYIEERVEKSEKCLEADLKGFLHYKAAEKEYDKDAPKEELEESFIKKFYNISQVHKSDEKDFIEKLNNVRDDKQKGQEFYNFLNKIDNKKQEHKDGEFVKRLKAEIDKNKGPER